MAKSACNDPGGQASGLSSDRPEVGPPGGLAGRCEAKDIRCVCLDVDGVLTDGRIFVDDAGRVGRSFHVHDGLAIEVFQKLGGVVVICSGKRSEAITARARELGVEHVIQGSRDKLADLSALLTRLGLTLEQTAVIGDDLPDVPLMQRCGYPIAVANGAIDARGVARLVTERAGGQGAVREAIDNLLVESRRWREVQALFGITP